MSKNQFFVSGIGTGVGKTIVSAILCEAIGADYWKPVQSGDADNSDSMLVRSLVANPNMVIHPERHVLSQPMSPHAAAELDGVRISPRDFHLPHTDNALIVEGMKTT
jgi:dethiobiotin synthetase